MAYGFFLICFSSFVIACLLLPFSWFVYFFKNYCTFLVWFFNGTLNLNIKTPGCMILGLQCLMNHNICPQVIHYGPFFIFLLLLLLFPNLVNRNICLIVTPFSLPTAYQALSWSFFFCNMCLKTFFVLMCCSMELCNSMLKMQLFYWLWHLPQVSVTWWASYSCCIYCSSTQGSS